MSGAFIFILALLVGQYVNGAAAATCGAEFLSGVHNPYRFCSSVVDYAYLIADDSSADDMNVAVRGLAERYYVEYFPTACKESLKRALCAQVYLPCADGVVVKKPCASLCEATAGQDGVCGGLMERFGYQPDCTDSYIFDPSNDPAVCNALPNVEGKSLVADRNEAYVGSVCENYVEHYFVPEASVYYAPLAPMPLPNLFQGYQEASAADWISKMPKFVSQECNTAFRKVACATVFMKPQENYDLADTFGPVYLQQFPARDLCTNYNEECSWIIEKAPTLAIDCTTWYPGWDGNPLYLYPERTQYVKGVVYNGAWTLLATEPNAVDTEVAAATIIEPECPQGTVYPEDPSISRISYSTPGCALACPSALMTSKEWSVVGNDYLIVYCVCFSIFFWVLANNMFILKSKANGFIVAGVLILLVTYFARVILMSMSSDGSAVCSSNASYYDRYDSDHDGWDSCVAHANISLLSDVASLYVVSVLNAEMWFKIRHGMKDVHMKTHKLVIRSGFAALFAAWVFAFMFGVDVNIGPSGYLCDWRATDIMAHFWSHDFVIILIVGAMVCVDVVLAYTMVKMSSATGGSSFKKIWKSYKYIFGLMLSFVITWVCIIPIFFVEVYLVRFDSYVEGTTDYIVCLFDNFVTESDLTYLDICGERPDVRYPTYGHYILMSIYLFSAISQLVINYWSAAVSKYYLGLIDMCFQSSIASRMLPKSTHESPYESKVESSIELSSRKKSVAVITASQLKNSKVVPTVGNDDGQRTYRSEDSSGASEGNDCAPLSENLSPKNRDCEIVAIREVDEGGRTLTDGAVNCV